MLCFFFFFFEFKKGPSVWQGREQPKCERNLFIKFRDCDTDGRMDDGQIAIS